MQKAEQNSYDVCYNLPVALSIPFTKDDKGNYQAYEYQISIPDISLKFSVLTPVFIGDLFQVAQKSTLELQNGEKEIVRQKVICKPSMAPISLSVDRFDALRSSNVNFWLALNPTWKEKMKIFSDIPLNDGILKDGGYGSLRKQYLIAGNLIEDNFLVPSLKPELLSDTRPLSPQEIRANLDSVYVTTKQKENEHLIVLLSLENINRLTFSEFSKALFETLFPPGRTDLTCPYKDLTSFMMAELDLKKEEFGMLNMEGSLKTISIGYSNRGVTKDLGKLIRNLQWDTIRAIDETSLCLCYPCTSFGTVDHNKYEGIDRYVPNVSLKKAKTKDFTKLSLQFSSELKRLPLKLEDLDKALRIPPTLIQIERMAQVREFKLLMDFGFIKDHLLFKALNARAIDKCNNNETLETLGDTVLKTLVTINLYFSKDKRLDPNQMTKEKVKLINNNHLADRGRSTPLLYYLKDKYTKIKDFIPPYMLPTISGEVIYDESQIIADGMIADSLEAIIGKSEITRRYFCEQQKIPRLSCSSQTIQGVTRVLFEELQRLVDLRVPQEFRFYWVFDKQPSI